jgi:carboxypeptidase C (cathepsin A)
MFRAWFMASILMIGSAALAQPATQPSRGNGVPAQAAIAAGARRGGATTQSEEIAAPVVTDHEVKIAGLAEPLHYKSTAGFIPLKDAANKLRARVFYISYEKTPLDAAQLASRPITFVFNGGPGAAAIWLHLGTAGPMRVGVPEDGSIPTPPYQLQENAYSWLDFTDLVCIDPVGTGYSRAEEGREREFYNVQGDVTSVADVIRTYLTEHSRWPSPKFVAGESYGTTRAAALSELLHDRYGIDASGIALISTVLNFQTLQFPAGNDTPYPLWLPSYTAIAWYHKKLAPELQQMQLPQVVAEAQKWAMDEYMPALLKGNSLQGDARDRVIQQLSRFSGLPMDYVRKSQLKIAPGRFEKSLLASQQKLIGRMDGRITAHDADPLNDTPDFDPSLTGYLGVFSSCFNDYVRRELKFESDLNYEFLSPNVGNWEFSGRGGEGYLDVSGTLRSAMTKVPAMKVIIASGYYDLATPFGAADYTVNQMPLGDLRKNIAQTYYEGGHMLYLNHPALVKLHDDLKSFYQSALPRPQ